MIFEGVAIHEDVAWLSNYRACIPWLGITDWVVRAANGPGLWVRRGKPQYRREGWYRRFIPRPTEAYGYWRRICGESFLWDFDLPSVGMEAQRTAIRSALSSVVSRQHRRWFAAKLTGPPRIRFLRSVFPQACFVHVVRDGRAVVESLLRTEFWRVGSGLQRPFWNGALGEEDMKEWEQYRRECFWRSLLSSGGER